MLAAIGLIVAVISLVRWQYYRVKAADLRRIEHKIDVLTEALSEAVGPDAEIEEPLDALTIDGKELARSATRSDLARVERKIDAIVWTLGLQEKLWPPIGDGVRVLWRQGRKVDAIRGYREANPGLGLREAKEILEWALE